MVPVQNIIHNQHKHTKLLNVVEISWTKMLDLIFALGIGGQREWGLGGRGNIESSLNAQLCFSFIHG